MRERPAVVRLVDRRRAADRDEARVHQRLFGDAARRAGVEHGGAVASAVVVVYRDGTLGAAYNVGESWSGLVAGVASLAHQLQVDP